MSFFKNTFKKVNILILLNVNFLQLGDIADNAQKNSQILLTEIK